MLCLLTSRWGVHALCHLLLRLTIKNKWERLLASKPIWCNKIKECITVCGDRLYIWDKSIYGEICIQHGEYPQVPLVPRYGLLLGSYQWSESGGDAWYFQSRGENSVFWIFLVHQKALRPSQDEGDCSESWMIHTELLCIKLHAEDLGLIC